MKYFIEVIDDKQWIENMDRYWDNFDLYSNMLPKRFVKEYKKHAFHDYEIISVNFFRKMLSSRTENNIEIVIQYDNEESVIVYEGVKKYDVNINNILYEGATWLYSEITPCENKLISHEIILDNKNTIKIEFKKIKYRKKIY